MLVSRYFTFRMAANTKLPSCITRRQPNRHNQPEKGQLMIRNSGETSLSAMPTRLTELGEVLVNAWYQVVTETTNKSQKRPYMLVTFVFGYSSEGVNEQRRIELFDAVNLFVSLCTENFWRLETYMNENSWSVSAYGRVPTHNSDGSPIMIWKRLSNGEKDLESPKEAMAPSANLTIDHLGFCQLDYVDSKKK